MWTSTFSESDAMYRLTVTTPVKVHKYEEKVTEFFDTYGYMHRDCVKAKLIDRFMADLK